MLKFDLAGERQIINACLSNRDKCGQILQELNTDDIYNKPLSDIFISISEVYSMTGDSTLSTVRAKLIEKGFEKHIEVLMDLSKEQPIIYIAPCIESLKALSKRRKIDSLLESKLAENIDPDEMAGELVNKLVEISQPKRKQMAHIKDIIKNEVINKEGYLKTVSWIDGNISGVKRGNLVIIGARTHTGKTINSIDIARVCAKTYNVLFFTLESPRDQITRILLTQLCGVPTDGIQSDLLSENERESVDFAKDYAGKLNLKIIDGVRDVAKITNIIRSESMNKQIDFVFVDYLQRIYATDRKQQRHLQIGEVCKTMKDIAEDTRSCVIIPSQMSRASDQSEEEPELSDLRESGDIEQDADVIFLMWKRKKGEKHIRVKCEKNRNNGVFFREELYFDCKRLFYRQDSGTYHS
jgi:replicative DNA helicase